MRKAEPDGVQVEGGFAEVERGGPFGEDPP